MGFRSRRFTLAVIWSLAVIAILPVVLQWPRRPPIWSTASGSWFSYAVAVVVSYLMYRRERRRLTRAAAFSLALLIFSLTSIVNHIHSFNVDHGRDYFPVISNEAWQEQLNDTVVRLAPEAIPHSYRFLPNSFVRWLQIGGLQFGSARDLYRLVFGLLLFYAVYKYSRLYSSHVGAILVMLLVAAVYPISFERYAGQLTDPMSHLSFVLAFIFIETGQFGYLLSTLLIGALAKETVLAMAGFYVLFCRGQKHYSVKATVLTVSSLAIYFGVRFAVLKSGMTYHEVSGVAPDFVHTNWSDETWPPVFFLTGGVFLPFLILGWNQTPLSLKRLVLFLLPVLFLSSLLFSWLHEARNFMPLVFVSAVITARYLMKPPPTYASTQSGSIRMM